MKHLCYVLVPLALILFISEAQGQETDRSGWAFHAGIGGSIISDEDGSETFRGGAFAYNFGIEYRMRNNFALGFSLFDLGTAEDTIGGVDTEIGVQGFDFNARFIFGSGGSTEFYALIGSGVYDADVSTGGAFSGDYDAWEIGAGVDFYTSERAAIRAELRFLNGPDEESGGLVKVGFNFRF